MVVALGPGKFYGSSLPRPRIYTDVKFNDERVDPPPPVLDPLISWAEEAHWSMGGLSFKRLRLQGRIEGNVKKLRTEREKLFKKKKQSESHVDHIKIDPKKSTKIAAAAQSSDDSDSPSPPPAPVAFKRRRVLGLIEDDDEVSQITSSVDGGKGDAENEESGIRTRRRLARKLGDDFERVAQESGLSGKRKSPLKKSSSSVSEPMALARRTRSQKREIEGGDEAEHVNKKMKSNGKKLKPAGKISEIADATVAIGVRSSPRLAKRALN